MVMLKNNLRFSASKGVNAEGTEALCVFRVKVCELQRTLREKPHGTVTALWLSCC